VERITGRKNSICVHAKNLGKDSSYRKAKGEFLCDGRKLLDEAVKNNAPITAVFTTEDLKAALPENTPVYLIDQSIMDSISPLKSPQNVLFTCKLPPLKTFEYRTGTHILLDNIQDPGNVGTIIRCADAFGINSVIFFGSTADAYNPKAVRASMGAIFRQRIGFVSIGELEQISVRIIGTSGDNGYLPVYKADLKDAIIVMGNEGQGISEDLKRLCGETICIPITPGCESLNVAVAASIIMYEAKKGIVHDI